MSASQVISSSSTQSELFDFNQPLSPETVSGHSSDSDSSSGSDDSSSSHSHSHHSPTSTSSHHSQNHHHVAYLSTEQQQQEQTVTRATPTNHTLPERPLVPTCPADWEAKKDIIYDLYMNKNFILNDVVEIMLSTHRFKATARMYKGQFAKWRWAKYNKSGNTNATKPTKSRSMRRKGVTSSGSGSYRSNGHVSKPGCQSNFISQPAQMIRLYFQSEPTYLVESTLLAYASYIARWADPERETPWKMNGPNLRLQIASDEINAEDHATVSSNSILQNIALAIRHLRCNNPQGTAKGGVLLRHAFLQIEEAITSADEGDIQAIWDCCLAVPQLLILHNASSPSTKQPLSSSSQSPHRHQPPHDILPIYTRFLHHLTTLKYAQTGCTSHPLHQISSSLHHLVTTSDFASLHLFITRAWKLWINTCRQLRGETDHVTIHLKRGYVILMDPEHAIVKNLVSDFGGLVRREMERWGEGRTTERILELEGLLGRMYLPLFDAGVVVGPGAGQGGTGIGAGQRARGMLGGLVERLEEKYRVRNGNRGDTSMMGVVADAGSVGRGNNMITSAPRPQHGCHDLAPGHLEQPPFPIPMQNWEYLDRYLFFSAHHFLASIADHEGDVSTAVALRRKILVMNGGGLPAGTVVSSSDSHQQLPFGTAVGTGMHMGLGIGLGRGLGLGDTGLGMTIGPVASMGPFAAGLRTSTTRGKDQFWVQTSRKVEAYLRDMGKWEEAEEVRGLLRDREMEVERERERGVMVPPVELELEQGRDFHLVRDMQVMPMTAAAPGLHMGMEMGRGESGTRSNVPPPPYGMPGAAQGAVASLGPLLVSLGTRAGGGGHQSFYAPPPPPPPPGGVHGLNGNHAAFGRRPLPVPIPRSVPVTVRQQQQQSVRHRGNRGFEVDAENMPVSLSLPPLPLFPTDEQGGVEFDEFTRAGGGSGHDSGSSGSSDFHHDHVLLHGNVSVDVDADQDSNSSSGSGSGRYEDRWGMWHEVMAL
ncbi:uncharacterized protein B0T23DRAFT_431000 [Neurospora hispaniola]|uniref:Clr5 domain-containing protein n=1 Tax=Neurospora hispaniola TaxID=588809 RepID=A0AAJ0I4R0_9PEZI|nr:hypothetical protein B0T23DRAFT_431000 [Neurospora hispaniola]